MLESAWKLCDDPNPGTRRGALLMPDLSDDRPMLIDASAVRAGDIFLHYRAKRKGVTAAIEAVTGSPYTHASIYLGDGILAEASPPKVRRTPLIEAMADDSHIAVFRSQCGFGPDRVVRLNAFIDQLIQQHTWYDLRGLASFNRRKTLHEATQFERLHEFFENNAPPHTLTNRPFFCSALVVACYCAVGIIDDSAAVIYSPDVYAPGALGTEPTFGHILGYLAPTGYEMPATDPFLNNTRYEILFGNE